MTELANPFEGIDAPGRDHQVYILARTDPEWEHGIGSFLAQAFLMAGQQMTYLCTFHHSSGAWLHAVYDATRLGEEHPTQVWPVSPGWTPMEIRVGQSYPSMLVVMNLPALTDAQTFHPEEWAQLSRLRREMQQMPRGTAPGRLTRAQAARYAAIAQYVPKGPPYISV